MEYMLEIKQVVRCSLLVLISVSAVLLGSFFITGDCADALYPLTAAADTTDTVKTNDSEQNYDSDRDKPVIEISGVDNLVYNSETIKPIITYLDESFVSGRTEISLVGANLGKVDVSYNREFSPTGSYIVLQNIEQDDVYTLTVKVTDGNGRSEIVSKDFSVNRSGSTFSCENCGEISGKTVINVNDIIVNEYCVDKLESYDITLFKNSLTLKLVEGKDFEVNIIGDKTSGFRYDYTLFAENFEDDADYAVRIHSVGKKSNYNESTANVPESQYNLEFSIDKIPPEINALTDFKSDTTYYEISKFVLFTVTDNSNSISFVSVTVDGRETARWDKGEENQGGHFPEDNVFSFFIGGNTLEPHNVAILCVDGAGNEKVMLINKVVVTGNVFLKNGGKNPLTFALILCIIVIIAGILVLKYVRKELSREKSRISNSETTNNGGEMIAEVGSKDSMVSKKTGKAVKKHEGPKKSVVIAGDFAKKKKTEKAAEKKDTTTKSVITENNAVEQKAAVKADRTAKFTKSENLGRSEKMQTGEKTREDISLANGKKVPDITEKYLRAEKTETDRRKKKGKKNKSRVGNNKRRKSKKRSNKKRKKNN